MREKLYNLFIKRVPVDVEGNAKVTETEEIKLLNVFIAVFIAWFVYGAALFFYKDRGEFGDMFGSINTIFSGFAFGGIIYTIYQQRAEFRLQREELRLQREEVAKTNQAMTEQIKAANIQRFESTFFNMINLHNEIVKGVAFNDHEGRLAFEMMYNFLLSNRADEKYKKFETKVRSYTALTYHEDFNLTKKICNDFFGRNEKTVGHYMRNLYNIFRMIDENEWIDDVYEKRKYSRIIRSQLSAYELLLLFYNCFQGKGENFTVYTEKYNLFDNLIYEQLVEKNHLEMYKEISQNNLTA
ncbi:putative phage abortive infection protein [Paenibacillus sp. UMB7766-LJ446]|uniref:putative phage abortive infection protein n=1 Tax=Paenibacillus sp. UMB7766-LJ446 TaxID=3046313 RepID=UPI00254DA221|nr:putative phage abortive infection protein [Paenibacillus sp. UMB7766-LJ446]MDK8188795.1 putative phage abortive infection protein [Paenibacillus sp. UMB7766-LJ446]